MGRTPVRATTVRPDASAPQKKVRLRKNATARSVLDIPDDLLAIVKQDFGSDLQWVTDSILGQPSPQSRMAFEINAWEPVTPEMFGGIFDGMFTKKGHAGEIIYEGLVLMYRPFELTVEARHEENKARYDAIAAQQNMLKTGQIPGLSAGFEGDHPTALPRNVMTRTVRPPMDIPKD